MSHLLWIIGPIYNPGRSGSFIENLDKGGELTSFEAEKMLKIVRHMATKRTQLNPNRLGSLWVRDFCSD